MTVGTRIIRASLAVGTAHVLFKVASVLQIMVLGRYVAPGTYDVVYAFAFEGCIFSIFLLGEELIGPTFLPVFMREMSTRSEKAAWHFANTLLTLQFILLLGVVSAIFLFPGALTRLFTAWTPEHDPARFALGCKSVRWLAPALLCFSMGSTTYMILNGYKRFFLAAFGDAAWKICALLAVLIGIGWLRGDYRILLVGLLIGSVAKLGTHLAGLRRELRFIRPAWDLKNPALRQMLLLMLPLIGGIVLAKVRDIYNNVTVLSGLDTEGLMQANSFGRKLHATIGLLVPYSISIAMFPFMCEMMANDDRAAFGRLLSQSGRMLLVFFIPFSLICAVLAQPISSLLFVGGKFSTQEASWTALSMACYVLVLPAAGLEYLLMQAFFAHRKMLSVTLIGVVFSFLSIGISYLGIHAFGARGTAALAVVALGFTASRTIKSVTLATVLKRDIPFFPLRETAVFLAKSLAVGAAAAGLCHACVRAFEYGISPSQAKAVVLLKLALGGAASAAGFVLATRLCRLEEPALMVTWAVDRLRGRISPAGADARLPTAEDRD